MCMICRQALEQQVHHLTAERIRKRLGKLWEEHKGAPPATLIAAACEGEHDRVRFAAQSDKGAPPHDVDACTRLLARSIHAIEGMDC